MYFRAFRRKRAAFVQDYWQFCIHLNNVSPKRQNELDATWCGNTGDVQNHLPATVDTLKKTKLNGDKRSISNSTRIFPGTFISDVTGTYSALCFRTP